VKIGVVCPYSFDVPGGVQSHVTDLARVLGRLGHEVDVLAPADDDAAVPDFVTPSGRAVGVPYNGSVARLAFGPVSFTRVRRWLRMNDFDVLHLHEPTVPSLSMLALTVADGPIVATFHTSTPRSRALTTFGAMLQPFLEKITARIAVSALARRVQMAHLGADAVEIPNGVDVPFYAHAAPLPGYPRRGGTVGFVGRYDEPRKGMTVLLDALRPLVAARPELRLLVVGPGDADALLAAAGPALAGRMVLLGRVDDETKARALRSVDVYCAPNTGGESFGIILTEAMAAGTAVLASDLEAFRRVLDGSAGGTGVAAGELVPVGDSAAFSSTLAALLDDPVRRAALAHAGQRVVLDYDWRHVAAAVLRVYQAAIAADPRRVSAVASGVTGTAQVPADLGV
jgi:phosphatidyl-myo-inositol alpha-mannosyltransferase